MSNRQLTRSTTNRVFAGVSGGIAQYTGADSGLVRLLTGVAMVIFPGAGILLYILAWIILPEEGSASTGLDKILGAVKSHTKSDNPNPNDLR
ncbi:MAG: PspC domain-containing protein [Propionibacteriaceae bacterium]|nr:PspC domain-containing protein [Propionibacteriaceae bacterium]